MTYYDTALRIMSIPLAVALFLAAILGFMVTIGAISSGIPILIIGIASLVGMFISLGLWHYILSGEDEPPWWG